MKSYIFAAAAALSAVANGVVVRRTDPNCEETKNGGIDSYGSTNTHPGQDGTSTNTTLPCGATSTTTRTVVEGDTLNTISAATGAGVCDIASLNQISNPNLINLGQVLTIPIGCTSIDNSTCVPAPEPEATETCVPGLPNIYIVQSGDTLGNIAKDFNITLASVIAANSANIPNPDVIAVAQQVNIPVCPRSQCAVVGTYEIASGDLFVDLAESYGTTIGQIKALNIGVDPAALQVGQQIVLPQGCANVTTAVA